MSAIGSPCEVEQPSTLGDSVKSSTVMIVLANKEQRVLSVNKDTL